MPCPYAIAGQLYRQQPQRREAAGDQDLPVLALDEPLDLEVLASVS